MEGTSISSALQSPYCRQCQPRSVGGLLRFSPGKDGIPGGKGYEGKFRKPASSEPPDDIVSWQYPRTAGCEGMNERRNIRAEAGGYSPLARSHCAGVRAVTMALALVCISVSRVTRLARAARAVWM